MDARSRWLIAAAEGDLIDLGGLGVVFKVAGALTGGGLAIVEHPIAPGVLAPPHVHDREDEISYVLEGNVGVRVGDDEFTAGPGSFVVKPRGIPHAFWNAHAEPARIIEIISPAGFERYFAEVAPLIAAGGERDAIARLRQRYGLTAHEGWTADLMQRYGLTVRGTRR